MIPLVVSPAWPDLKTITEQHMIDRDGRERVVIEAVSPTVDNGAFPIKRTPGETVTVSADLFADGHDEIAASVLFKSSSSEKWHEVAMEKLENDRFQTTFTVDTFEPHSFKICGRIDSFASWKKGLIKKHEAGQNVSSELLAGAHLISAAAKRADRTSAKKLARYSNAIENTSDQSGAVSTATESTLTHLMYDWADRTFDTHSETYSITVDRKRALYSSWYELFPRSCTNSPETHGTFATCEKELDAIAAMGFHVVYFPPIHPIGRKNRKGKNNNVTAQPGEPGSPWAIGAPEGGHKAVNPALGTMDDFTRLVKKATTLGLEIALDLAYQCAPDHPYVSEHPQWFKKRPDGTIQYAENPPKRYEDIVPFDFETSDWRALWSELKSVVDFWIDKGILIFRVDNPHTKAFPFWEWMIGETKREHPEVIFLAEAFTRPKPMQRLAKIGFGQSYTYYTWRNTRWELMSYMNELTTTGVREFFRPNFWPNTPDILPEFLQYGGQPAFALRVLLAGTLSSNYGIYGPAYEECISEALPGKEEYAYSEKYEVKKWNRERPLPMRDLITRLNAIRETNPALQSTSNIRFFDTDNESIIGFSKATPDLSNIIFVFVNLDPYNTRSGWTTIPLDLFELSGHQSYFVHDLLTGNKYEWQGSRNFIQLDPHKMPAHIFRVYRNLKHENDFDYYN